MQKNNEIWKLSTKKQNIWFTSDTHFSHGNIIKYCDRPFDSFEEMNGKLIDLWNMKVKPGDIVFHLGDFGFDSIENLKKIRSRLNGTIYLIRGNHDWKTINKFNEHIFDGVYQQLAIQVDCQRIYLNHYPYLCFSGSNRWEHNSTWQLFGHVHSKDGQFGLDKSRLSMLYPTQYDVGVDNNNYTPVSFAKVKEIINNQIKERKTWKSQLKSKILKVCLQLVSKR